MGTRWSALCYLPRGLPIRNSRMPVSHEKVSGKVVPWKMLFISTWTPGTAGTRPAPVAQEQPRRLAHEEGGHLKAELESKEAKLTEDGRGAPPSTGAIRQPQGPERLFM